MLFSMFFSFFRERERGIMEEGRSLWQNKKREQLEQEIREQEEVQFF